MKHLRLGTLLLAGAVVAAAAGCAPPTPDLAATLTAAPAQTSAPPPTATVPPPATTLAAPTETATLPPTEMPPPTPAPNATPVLIGGPAVSYNGVQLALDAGLASGVSAHVEPASDVAADVEPWGVHPAYTELRLVDYPSRNRYFQPHIAVYPVAAFEAMSPQAAQTIQRLRDLLAARPAEPAEAIPLLPILNAAQMLRTRVQYIAFQNGSGVRFFTQYDQAYMPVNNQELFYTFQGLSADGAFYVSAILPVSAPFLADVDDPEAAPPEGGIAFPSFSAADFEAQALAYLQAMTQKLEAAPGADFTPDAAALDGLIASLQVPAP